ncbi:hypothetical protein ACFQDE_08625 [Deinococcus caeni]|uniref:hypothetical protein n=1 Tax=Deinococcus caeni TaxID=569127 RepID=UPI003612F374
MRSAASCHPCPPPPPPVTSGRTSASRSHPHPRPDGTHPDGTHYDFIVIGAGRMGSLLTLALTRAAPHARLLLIEQGGLPNEEGHTILAPGVWTTAHLPPDQHPAAHASRTLIEELAQPTPAPTSRCTPTRPPAACPAQTPWPPTRTASPCSIPASSRTPRPTRTL